MAKDPRVPHVSIILLNYQGADDTIACLQSIAKQITYPSYEVVVVDNASGDDSLSRLREAQQQGLAFHLIESPENNGFSAGNNLGIEYAMLSDERTGKQPSDYVWLLNNDTLLEMGALTHLVNESQKTGGLVGSLILYPNRTYQQVGVQFNWKTGRNQGYKETDIYDGMLIEALSGASMLIPTKVFSRIGKLDESYFLYFEDCEFSLRASEKNYPLTLAIRSRVYHKEGATTGKKSLPTQYYYHRNRLKFLMTYATDTERASIMMYMLFRLIRGWFKATNAERKASAKIQWLAFQDFMKGVGGPCPHDLII